jgi:hypothetical protein
MAHKLRHGLSDDPARPLRGFLEADETVIGGRVIQAAPAEGTKNPDKSLVVAAVEKLPAPQEKRDHAVKRQLGFLAGDARIVVSPAAGGGRTRRFSENQARGRFASPDRRVCQLPQPEVCWLRSHSTPMRSLSFSICLASAGLAACTYLPTAGPTAGDVVDQRLRYDVVDIIRAPVARRRDRDRRYRKARDEAEILAEELGLSKYTFVTGLGGERPFLRPASVTRRSPKQRSRPSLLSRTQATRTTSPPP